MHYLSAEGLTKSYGVKPLFSGITFHISEGDKIALIARNGSGKSTLLRILAGQETAEEGTVRVHKDVLVALFEQEPRFEEEKTVIENIFHYPHPAAAALREYELAVAINADAETVSAALVKMDELGAWDFEAKVAQILGKLRIGNLDQPVRTLSGGQRKRVALAQTLIDIGFEPRHTLLILDEPTNHLDVEMVEWLEHYLTTENTTLLMVTHDRYFLDAVCEEIWEIDGSNLYTYRGDYANYLEKKAARIESHQASIDKARNEYRKELEWMRKQPKARTTKSRSREQNFYEVEKQAKQRIVDNQVELQMKMNRLGGKVAELKKVYKAYGEKTILKGFDYTFKKGERLGIIGRNGTGKSTFINMLLGKEPSDSGKINIGDTVVFGHFSQSGLEYKEDVRVIEHVKNIAESFPLANGKSMSAAQFLELFLFPPEQQYTHLSRLSGGEKKRLQLLSILFRNPNFLILDEPTNDLDLPTLSVLEAFLSEYAGCLLIVSHDRYFMDRLVDHLFVFEGGGEVRDFPGNYSQYRAEAGARQEESEDSGAAGKEKLAHNATVASPAGNPKPEAQDQAGTLSTMGKSRKPSYKELREWEALEKDIPQLEQEKASIAARMSEGLSYDELQKLSARISEITALLEEKETRWLELSEVM